MQGGQGVVTTFYQINSLHSSGISSITGSVYQRKRKSMQSFCVKWSFGEICAADQLQTVLTGLGFPEIGSERDQNRGYHIRCDTPSNFNSATKDDWQTVARQESMLHVS